MAWNKPTGDEAATKRSPSRAKSPIRGIAAALIVVAGAVVAWLVLSPGDKHETEKSDKAKAGLIKEVTPAATPKAEEPKKVVYKTQAEKDFAETNGLSRGKLARWWLDRRPPAQYTNDTTRTAPKEKYEIFDHHCDNSLACLLTMTPGDTLVGDVMYERWFVKDFLKSLETPIIVTKDDTPEQAELKRAVIAAKIDLKARHDAGEDIAQVMRETRAELQKMAAYKAQVRDQLYQLKRDGIMSDADMEGYVEAANKMLEQKGIAPLKFGPLVRRNLKLRKQGL